MPTATNVSELRSRSNWQGNGGVNAGTGTQQFGRAPSWAEIEQAAVGAGGWR
jgi:hypothetical protein